MCEPLGKSQVLTYLTKLSKDYQITLISFEKISDYYNKRNFYLTSDQISKANIRWIPLLYHKSFPLLSTLIDISKGVLNSVKVVKQKNINIIHARSFIPSIIALCSCTLSKSKYIYDMRGFWVDERLESGQLKKKSIVLSTLRFIDRILLSKAFSVIVLTNAAKVELIKNNHVSGKKISVIPTCVNLENFKRNIKLISSKLTLCYLGSTGSQYLFDKVVLFFKELVKRNPNAFLKIINKNDHDYIKNILNENNIEEKYYEVLYVEHSSIPRHLVEVNFGIMFYKNTYSRIGCSPTRLGEFLSLGIPIICNSSVGDVRDILMNKRVGVLLEDYSIKSLEMAISNMYDIMKQNNIDIICRKTAKSYFDIESAIVEISKIYLNN